MHILDTHLSTINIIKDTCKYASPNELTHVNAVESDNIPTCLDTVKVKVKFSHTRYRALGPELIPVYRQSARR